MRALPMLSLSLSVAAEPCFSRRRRVRSLAAAAVGEEAASTSGKAEQERAGDRQTVDSQLQQQWNGEQRTARVRERERQ